MYILNASVETSYIGALRFDLLRCNATIAMVKAITNAVILPVVMVPHRLRSVAVGVWKLRIGESVWHSKYEMNGTVSVNKQP